MHVIILIPPRRSYSLNQPYYLYWIVIIFELSIVVAIQTTKSMLCYIILYYIRRVLKQFFVMDYSISPDNKIKIYYVQYNIIMWRFCLSVVFKCHFYLKRRFKGRF